jgi:hypothetical protein
LGGFLIKFITMKKIILFLALITSALFYSQYQKLDSIALQKTIEKIVSDTGKPFVISKKDEESRKFYIKYKNPENENDNLMILYYSYYDGANEDLEIKGTKVWDIQSISGNFLSIFPVWQKFSGTKTDAETLSKKGFEYYTTPDGNSTDFVKMGPFWTIRI